MGGFGMILRSTLMVPPLNVAYIAAVLERGGYEVHVLDAVALRKRPDEVVTHAVELMPDVIGLNTASATVKSDLELADLIKRALNVKTFAFGSQVSLLPDSGFEHSNIDFIVRGEAEFTCLELLKAFDAGSEFSWIQGLSFRTRDGIVHNEERPFIESLDSLPFPAFHLMPVDQYNWPGMKRPTLPILATRGCPVNCSFCPYPVSEGLAWRKRSPKNVVDEIEELQKRHAIRSIVFRDPVLTLQPKWAERVCDLMIERQVEVEWSCETTLGSLRKGLLTKMKEAGCVGISVGVESGNEYIRKRYAGNKIRSPEHAADVIRHSRSLGLEVRTFFMIGFPEETPQMAQETIDFAIRLDPDSVQFTAVTPYPGTEISQILNRYGDDDFSGFTGYKALSLRREMTPAQIRKLIRRGYRKFYLRPERLMKEIVNFPEFVQKSARYLVFDR